MTRPLLELDLTLPLADFTLRVEATAASRVVGVFGRSGAGKTSLLEAIAGLRRGVRGRLVMDGTVWQDDAAGVWRPARERLLGYVPQDHLLFPHRNVRTNVLAGAARARRAGLDVAARFDEVVALLELEPLLDRPVANLSGGERQRVALARALCSGARLLLLDEPLGALDLARRRQVLHYLRAIIERFGVGVVMVSHQPAELLAVCTEVIVLERGKVMATGAPREVLARPEVLGSAEAGHVENLVPARVRQRGAGEGRVAMGTDGEGPELRLLSDPGAAGEAVLLRLCAEELLISQAPPVGLSARNAFAVEVERIESVGARKFVVGRVCPAADVPPITSEVTADAVAELGIAPGVRVWFVIKSSAISVYG